MKKYRISELAFDIVDESESTEGFNYSSENVTSTDENLMQNISKEVILEFLKCDDTKVWAVKNSHGDYDIIAKNKISNEQVKISGLGNHFMALVKIVKEAEKRVEDTSKPLLNHSLIKNINLQILKNREGEIGIGEYRNVDYFGNPVEMCFAKVNKDGNKEMTNRCVHLENSTNVAREMDKLINWVNNEAFKDEKNFMEDIAKFHAEFLRIHPFCEGNGRTCRLITDYLLLTQGKNLINIPAEIKLDYYLALNYANAVSTVAYINEGENYKAFYEKVKSKYGERSEKNKYLPLRDLLIEHIITNSNELINQILNYTGSNLRNFSANQINA